MRTRPETHSAVHPCWPLVTLGRKTASPRRSRACFAALCSTGLEAAGGEDACPAAPQSTAVRDAVAPRRTRAQSGTGRGAAARRATATMSHWHKLGFQAFLAKEIMRKDTLPFAIGMGCAAPRPRTARPPALPLPPTHPDQPRGEACALHHPSCVSSVSPSIPSLETQVTRFTLSTESARS